MPSVQIHNVSEETHAVLRRRATVAHQSLQEFLSARLVEESRNPLAGGGARPCSTRPVAVPGAAGGTVSFRGATRGPGESSPA